MKKILIGLAIVCMMCVVPSASVWAIAVRPVVEVDHPVIMANKEVTVYILVRFRVEKLKEDPSKPRPKLNLALVIDRSGSMESKGKLEYAIEASNILVVLFFLLRTMGKVSGTMLGTSISKSPSKVKKYAAGGLIP